MAVALCSPLKDFLVEELHDRSKVHDAGVGVVRTRTTGSPALRGGGQMTRWIDAVDETKKLRITSLDQLEVDRDYKTEQGIPIKRLPTNEIDLAGTSHARVLMAAFLPFVRSSHAFVLAGKILLKIHSQHDAKPGLTVLVCISSSS